MIALLTGRLAAKHPDGVVVDVGGVGYEVHIPLSSYYNLPDDGSNVTLHVHTHVREDAITLFGFSTLDEKALFLLLNSVNGVGPKLALNIISGLPPERLVDAIRRGDDALVTTIPGVGKKTAARIVLELKDKVETLGLEPSVAGPCSVGSGPNPQRDEAVSALVNLGYKKGMAEEAVKKVCTAEGDQTSIETLIKDALKVLAKG
jgi:holliday junction DNA helicase RuvA